MYNKQGAGRGPINVNIAFRYEINTKMRTTGSNCANVSSYQYGHRPVHAAFSLSASEPLSTQCLRKGRSFVCQRHSRVHEDKIGWSGGSECTIDGRALRP